MIPQKAHIPGAKAFGTTEDIQNNRSVIIPKSSIDMIRTFLFHRSCG